MLMNPERWRQLEELYHSALERPAALRSGFLAQACTDDPELQHEIEALLAQSGAQSNTAGILDRPAWENAPGFLEETHTQFAPGQQLGPYLLAAKIGEGGMGAVYRAHDSRLGRDVALKIATARFSARFEREARAIAALNHPHICTLYDVGPNYLVMELLEGETLAARLARGALPADEILGYAGQLSDALAEAHRLGVVHRDLKPSNIFLTRNGVKILDFGIAKNVTDPGMTEPNVVIGTPAYMAPEQLRGKPADARSDLFSLGLVLYEMSTGALPFPGSSLGNMLNSAPVNVPRTAKTLGGLGGLIPRLLEKEPAARPQSALEVRDYLRKLAPGTKLRRRTICAAVVFLLIAAGVFGTQAYLRRSRARWAQNEGMPEVARLMRQSRWLAATDLLRRVARYAPESPELIRLEDLVPPANIAIETEPAGADLFIRDYTGPDDDAAWQHLGRTPVKTNRLPQSNFPRGYYVVRAAKPGFETVERALALGQSASPFTEKIELHSKASSPAGMVWVPSGSGAAWLGIFTPQTIPGFWIDRYEVTNRQFKDFVDRGGYQKRQYWKEPFERAGKSITWEQAMAEFRDETGRPGPSTWRLGAFRDGQADFPVGGVSWYEASAYAEFAGKSLPTAYHWLYAGDTGPFSDVLSFANFGGQGPAPVGKFRALGQFGTFDMAGNVQEWVSTAHGDLRYTLGGAWNTPSYMGLSLDARLPFERGPFFGFRCVQYASPVPSSLKGPLTARNTDPRTDKPVDDQTFKVFQRLLDYDRSDLKSTLDSVEGNSYWRLENVSFQAGYNGERVSAHLYLPKNAAPPYQAVVFMGGPETSIRRTLYDEAAAAVTFGFLLRSGRAVLVPAYKGTMERGPMPGTPGPNQWREMLIARSKDLRRSMDYLETRPDIDLGKVAFAGVSQGAALAPFLVALEPRIKTAVLVSGGTYSKVAPEVDSWNYAPRVTIPVLMINGRSDSIYPLESTQLPLFRALGTPAKDKKHVLFEGGHATPVAQPDMIKAYLDWLDQYLGPVQLHP
jgi:formylglycine-generating enzyme required for sulfatase activity/predicted esterase